MTPKIVLPGGTGFLGGVLANWLGGRGWEVVVLSRRSADAGSHRVVAWDGVRLGPWANELENAAAVVNLAGRSVNCRYNARNRAEILESRVASTRVLGQAIARCVNPPPVWLNSSTATIYRHALDRPMDEAGGELGEGFSVGIARAWEDELAAAPTSRVRKVALRTAMVMGTGAGGPFAVFRRLTRCGLGGSMGPGNQFVSWVHEIDFCRAIEWLIARDAISGAVNVAAPHPLPNAEFMRLLRRACAVPIGLPSPRWMLELGAVLIRTETELPLKSRYVVPARLLEAEFTFEFPDWSSAATDLVARSSAAGQRRPA